MLRGFRLISRDPLAFLAQQWRAHGDVVQFPIPSPPTYLVSDPSDVRAVLVGHAREVTKDTIQYRALRRVTGLGLLTSDGALWRRHRRVVQPAFHHDRLPGVVAHTTAAGDRLVSRLRAAAEQDPVDLDVEVMALALEVVGDALFGHELGPVAERLASATLSALSEVVATARTPLRAPTWIPTPGNRRMARALAQLDEAVDVILTARRTADGPPTGDLLDLLLGAPDLDLRAVRDEIVTFLVAGHETVASALTWAFLLLGAHPGIADRVAQEAARALPAPGSTVDLRTVAELAWSRAVLDEAMRLYPPAWLITRRTLAPMELSGRRVPAGSLVIISPWIVHRHPAAWVDPERFDPQRFLGEPRADRRASFIPFGAGPRMCIGRDFAYAEAVVALSLVCRELRLVPVGPPVRPVPLVTIRPDRPALVRVAAR